MGRQTDRGVSGGGRAGGAGGTTGKFRFEKGEGRACECKGRQTSWSQITSHRERLIDGWMDKQEMNRQKKNQTDRKTKGKSES